MGRIVSPTGKPIKLVPIHPNAGIEAEYRRRLQGMVEEMHKSLVYWIGAAYRANRPHIAQDALPAAEIAAAMKRLRRRWQKRFDSIAPDLARHFATTATNRASGAMEAALRKAGLTVRLEQSAGLRDVLHATVSENVSLIRSIPQQHLAEVESLVMRSVARGRDLATLTKDLEARYGITRRRAAFIARDQNSKATSAADHARRMDLGLKESVWMHSHGGKHPRPSHVAADGKTYETAKGMFIDGRWTFPGEDPNCRCVSRAVVPGISRTAGF